MIPAMRPHSGEQARDRPAAQPGRRVAAPLPLGFLALAGGSVLFASLQLGWLAASERHDVAVGLLAFAAPLQFSASVWGFLGGDVVAGTGMGVLAGSWATTAVVLLTSADGATSDALGVLLVMAGVALLLTATGGIARRTVLPATVIGTASVRFGLTGLAQLAGGGAWDEAAGVAGLVLAALGVIVAAVLMLREVRPPGSTDALAREGLR